MINLNEIRTLEPLIEMKADLSAFLDQVDMKDHYILDLGWGEEDYDADVEKVNELLVKVNRRIASLKKFLSGSTEPITES